MVDFADSQEPVRPQETAVVLSEEEEEVRERRNEDSLDVLVQGESSQSIDTHTSGAPMGQAETNPLKPEDPNVVKYNADREDPSSMYSSEIPGQKPPDMGYDSKKDISQGYHP